MITEKNHKLLTSQLFVTDCTKNGLASMHDANIKDGQDGLQTLISFSNICCVSEVFNGQS
jgi:hypothetical protein